MSSEYEREKAFQRKPAHLETEFEDLWPSETRGNGKLRANNRRTGAAQGKGSFILKAPCRQCGFLNDLNLIDHMGGSLDGNGACFVSSTGTATTYPTGGGTHTENYGEPGTRKGSGCALCGSKNSTRERVFPIVSDPWGRPQPLGF